MAMDWHDTLMGSVLVISGGLTFAYTRAASKILLILTLIGAAATIVIGVLLFFHLVACHKPRHLTAQGDRGELSADLSGHGLRGKVAMSGATGRRNRVLKVTCLRSVHVRDAAQLSLAKPAGRVGDIARWRRPHHGVRGRDHGIECGLR